MEQDSDTIEGMADRLDEPGCRERIVALLRQARLIQDRGETRESILCYEKCFRLNDACLRKVSRDLSSAARALRKQGKREEARLLEKKRYTMKLSFFMEEYRDFIDLELRTYIKDYARSLKTSYRETHDEETGELLYKTMFVLDNIESGCN